MKHSPEVASSQQDKELETLREMKRAFGPRFVTIVEEYRTSLPGKLAAMRDAALMGAHDSLAIFAHRLAGASATLGALQVSAMCRDLENRCGEGSVPDDLQDRLERIAHASSEFCARLGTA